MFFEEDENRQLDEIGGEPLDGSGFEQEIGTIGKKSPTTLLRCSNKEPRLGKSHGSRALLKCQLIRPVESCIEVGMRCS